MGINRERIIENNLKLSRLKIQTEELPDYQDMSKIYAPKSYSTHRSDSLNSGIFNTGYPANGSGQFCYYKNFYSYGYDYINYNIVWGCGIKMITGLNTATSLITVASTNPNSALFYVPFLSDDQYLYYLKCNNGESTATVCKTRYKSSPSEETMFSISGFGSIYANSVIILADNKIQTHNRIFSIDFENQKCIIENSWGNSSVGFKHYVPYLMQNESNVVYSIIPKKNATITNLNFVNYSRTKAVVGNNLYYLNENLTLGNLIKENVIPYYVENEYMSAITSDLYASTDKHIYRFDENTNTFTVETGYENLAVISGKQFGKVSYRQSYNAVYFWGENYIDLIGYNVEGNKLFIHNDFGSTSDAITPNNTLYDYYGNAITGTMPNNGTLNYTPTTSQQTIPKGYTSGGTISGVTAAIDSNITQANVKVGTTILGVTGTFTSDGDAVASEIAEGKIAYVNGERVVGTFNYEDAGTLSPQEYEEAMGTADDILGIEPEPEIQDHYEIEYD